jgi:Xaa-Pro aminopeptidase
MSNEAVAQERVGVKFSLAKMLHARARTQEAVRLIGERIRPGMTEADGLRIAFDALRELGMERTWHQPIIRFGAQTLTTYLDRSDGATVLRQNDIFFVDLGAVWDGHEGDAGDTFVVGADPEMHACRQAIHELWDGVAAQWQQGACTGHELYAFADRLATQMGWRLNFAVKGHRLSDFPHAIYNAGRLAEFSGCPSAGLWVLELQLAHPTRPFGSFFEDLMLGSIA